MADKSNKNQVTRPPIVVVMGHVDHGKTSILDYIRKSHVTARESGGITQHIGASEVEFNGKKITFIDTPGHEAFSQMRVRGSKIADIAILVIAAEEGLKPQTKEAISAIRKAGVPMIVAMNKMDLPQVNVERLKRELQKEEVLVEDWGGDIPSIAVSAKTGKGIDELLEMITLVAEMEGLKADTKAPASGIIIESSLDKRRGPSATILLQNGSLCIGAIVATPTAFGKVKSLENSRGEKIDNLSPSQPAVLIGFENVPIIGEEFKEMENLPAAQEFVQAEIARLAKDLADNKTLRTAKEGQKIVNIVLKADFLGSLEVLQETIRQIPQNEVLLEIIHTGVGEINLNDTKMARSSQAIIIGFKVKTSPDAKIMAENEKLRVMNFDVIYEMIEWLRGYAEKIKIPQIIRKDLGKMKVLLSFWGEKNRQIVGGKITEGEVRKGVKIEVFRNERMASQGRLINLQKNKRNIPEASKGEEVGILYEGPEKIQEGDYLVFYVQEKNI